MQTRSIFISLLLVSTGLGFSNCSGNKTETSHDDHKMTAEEHAASTTVPEPSETQFTVDETFQQQLSAVFESYVALKDAFVSSDAAKVSAEASSTGKALAATEMKLLTGAAHNDWMNYLNGMETSLKTIETSGEIEAQRVAFSDLTENLYKSIKAYGLGGATAYYEFCPMAFDNQGGFWLSDASEIRNPYFGDKMLTCGTVKETLK